MTKIFLVFQLGELQPPHEEAYLQLETYIREANFTHLANLRRVNVVGEVHAANSNLSHVAKEISLLIDHVVHTLVLRTSKWLEDPAQSLKILVTDRQRDVVKARG